MVSELNLLDSNPRPSWIDTDVTKHVCSNKELLHNFKEFKDEKKLFIRNSATSDIKGQSKVVLKMTSRKELTFSNMLYVLETQKNLVFESFHSKHRFCIIFESDIVILCKNKIFVGKCYVCDGLFKLSVLAIRSKINKNDSSSIYMLKSSNF